MDFILLCECFPSANCRSENIAVADGDDDTLKIENSNSCTDTFTIHNPQYHNHFGSLRTPKK